MSDKNWDTTQTRSIANLSGWFWLIVIAVIFFLVLLIGLLFFFDRWIALAFLVGTSALASLIAGLFLAVMIGRMMLDNFVDAQNIGGTTAAGMFKVMTQMIGLKKELTKMGQQPPQLQPTEPESMPWDVDVIARPLPSQAPLQIGQNSANSGPVYLE